MILLLQQNPQPQPTASIEGSVLKLGTTEPIPRAKVTLGQQGSANSQTVTADDGGKFAFRNLAAGSYRLTATRDGYVTAEFGQRGPGASGVQITLTAQQQMRDAKIEMTLTGVISGRVLNRFGEPVGNANVQALRYTYQEGRRSLTPFQSIRTNDLGEYRLFWMTPGQYVISAQAAENLAIDPGGTIFFQGARGGGPALAGAFGAQLGVGGVTRIAITGAPPPDVMAGVPPPPPPPPPPPGGMNVVDDSNVTLPVYYPGTTDVAAAAPVELRSGGVIGGINFTVVEARPVRIRGQVINGGRPAAGAQVSIFQRGNTSGMLTIRNVPVNDMGAFEFRNIAPGAYELIATINAAGPGALIVGTPLGNAAGLTAANTAIVRGGRVPGAPVMAARTQVDVVNADVEGVTLLLENGFNVNGKVTLEGRGADGTTSGVRIQLQSDPVVPPLAIPAVNAEADGSFAITGVPPGNYRLLVGALPRNTYVKAALIGGIDILNSGGLRLDGEPRGGMEILLGSSPGSLEAVVVDGRKMPVSGVTVVLVPDSSRRKRYDIFRQATSDASGRVRIDNVVPGDYKVFAWEVVESNAWTDPDFLRNYENDGVVVRISEGGRGTADVTVIPYKAN